MSREKAIEICKNLEQSIERATTSVLSSKNTMFVPFTATKRRLQNKLNELTTKYKLTKKDLK